MERYSLRMPLSRFLKAVVLAAMAAVTADAATVTLDIFYPEELVALNRSANEGFEDVVLTAPHWYDEAVFRVAYFNNFTYVIRNGTDRVGPGHWRRTFSVGDTLGPIYFEVIEDQLNYRSMLKCDESVILFPGYCMPRHRVDIASSSDELSLTIYPFFDLRGKGITEVLLADFYSQQLGNVRDINVYWPYSLIENPTPRKINVLIVHDGTLDALKVFADTSAVDSLNAVGSIPEVIMIGLPNSPNGTACPSDLVEARLCVQRNYELTPTVCDPAKNFCPEFQPTGGADEYLEFVYADVIPAVLERLGHFELGEVSNVGFSFGGMTACWAASKHPDRFSRGICMSPSVWWNDGELISLTKSNYEEAALLPKSIVVSIGSQEALSWMLVGPVEPQQWGTYLQGYVDSFEGVGMGKRAPSTMQMHPDGSYYPTYASNLGYYIYEGGVHNVVNQADMLSYVLPLAYAYEYPTVLGSQQSQRNSLMTVVYPPPEYVEDDDCDNNSTSTIIGLSIALGIVSLLLSVAIMYIFCALRTDKLLKHTQRSDTPVNL